MTDQSTVETLDITSEVCPMTFVRARLALDRLPPGTVLQVRLRGDEPLRNVSANAVSLGHVVLDTQTLPGGDTLLQIERR